MTLTSITRRIAIAALVGYATLSAMSPVASALAAEDTDVASAATSAAAAAREMSTVSTPERCSLTSPCQVLRTSAGIELDLGGPSIRIDYFSDDD